MQHAHHNFFSRRKYLLSVLLSCSLVLTGGTIGSATAFANNADNVQQEQISTEDIPPNPQHMWNNGSESQDSNMNGNTTSPRFRSVAPGVRWGTSSTNSAYKTFTQSNGTVINPALKVIDISEWQGNVDWNAVKKSGIDGVILRIGYGYGNTDKTFVANLAKVRAAGIPFGLYLYSYAYDTAFASEEAKWTVQMLQQYGITDNAFPIFYDLEQAASWGGHTMPTTPSQYEAIARTYFDILARSGYTNTYIYSYLDYMNTALNSTWLKSRTAWIAQYNTKLDYTFPNYSGARAWQYTSEATVSGISGAVDMNVFDQQLFNDVNFRTAHYDDIVWLTQAAITTGYADNTFRGMGSIVRQDMAAFLRREAAYRNIGDAKTWKPSAADWNTFSDVTEQTPHAEDILWLAHAGIAEGYKNEDGTESYGGMTPVYRQDMAAFIKRLADLAGKSGGVTPRTSFSDVTEQTPHWQEIQWLGGAGISTGYQNANGTWRFEGMTTVYRQDMAAFMHRLDALLSK